MHNGPYFNPFFEAYERNQIKQEPNTFQEQMNKLDRILQKINFFETQKNVNLTSLNICQKIFVVYQINFWHCCTVEK